MSHAMGIQRVNHDNTYFSQLQGSVQIMADLSKPNLITGGQLELIFRF